jgi:hypothetical protein
VPVTVVPLEVGWVVGVASAATMKVELDSDDLFAMPGMTLRSSAPSFDVMLRRREKSEWSV